MANKCSQILFDLLWQVLGRRSLWGLVYSDGSLSWNAYVLIQGWVNNPGVSPVGALLILRAAPILWHHTPVNFSVCVETQLRCVWRQHCCNPTTQWPMTFSLFLCMVFKIHLSDYKAASTFFFTVRHFTLPYCCTKMMVLKHSLLVNDLCVEALHFLYRITTSLHVLVGALKHVCRECFKDANCERFVRSPFLCLLPFVLLK